MAATTSAAAPVASSSKDNRPTKRARLSQEAAEAREQLKLTNAQPYARINLKEKDLGQSLQGKHKNKKLQSRLATLHKSHTATAISSFEHDNLLLPSDNAGLLEPEDDVERTWRITQADIKKDVGVSAAAKGFDLNLDSFGPYSMDYTPNGRYVSALRFLAGVKVLDRHLAIAGRRGHVATFDWQSGKLHTEINLNETVRDICWLHDQSFFAVAQKKYVYIYDRQGVEIHQLRHHIDVNKLSFLRYHFLLSSIGSAGYLKYQDTSTGQVVCEHRTKLGACDTMAQNTHNGIIHLGHTNGTVTLWSPNMPDPHVKLLAHRGPVQSIAIDQGATMGHYMATSGLDGKLKVWDNRKWGVVNEWSMQKPAQSLTFSQKGLLGVGWGNHVSVYKDVFTPVNRRLGPYMTTPFPSRPISDLRFCPFEDVLGVGHSNGFTSLLIPGAGEANFDSTEADPYESKRSRQEREIASLMDKIQPDQITMDRDWIGKVARADAKSGTSKLGSAASAVKGKGIGPRQDQVAFRKMSRADRLVAKGQADVDTIAIGEDDNPMNLEGVEPRGHKMMVEKKSGKRVLGANKERRRALRKRANVIDAKTEQVKERLKEKREKATKAREQAAQSATGESNEPKSALDRFGSKR